MIRPAMAIVVMLAASCMCRSAEFPRDVVRPGMSLSGTWQRLLEHGDAEAWRPDAAAGLGPWEPVEVPGPLLPRATDEADRDRQKQAQCVWVQRTFQLTESQASGDVALRWGGIRFGTMVWINGTQVADYAPIAPHTVVLPHGLVRAGENRILLKVHGWAGMPRSESGFPLTPTGGATQPWGGKVAQVFDDIWLEFFDRALMKWILAVPPANGVATFRIWVAGPGELPGGLRVAAQVTDSQDGRAVGQAAAAVTVPADGGPFELRVDLDNPKRWSPEEPNLHVAELTLTAGDRLCDKATLTFGVRDIRVVGGHFRLNGKPLWLRGSNLVHEWAWGSDWIGGAKHYIVDQARGMSLNCFRTHTQPPTTEWLDVADRHGTMILAETPLLYNHGDFKYTEEEYEVFHRNALADATGWVTKLWNHPSIIMWVLSNESVRDNAWESGPLSDHVRLLDPTRPHMRTGEHLVGTRDMLDIHTCFAYTCGPEGALLQDMTRFAAQRDPERAISNTEYMNLIVGSVSTRWLGREGHPDLPLVEAEFGAEHTEAMRRLRFDCLLPYMYARWVRRPRNQWRDDWPTPMAAVLHSTMAPVLASWDLFDRNFAAGRKAAATLALINDTDREVRATVELVLTPENPVFIPDEAALEAAVWRESHEIVFDANAVARRPVEFPVPEREGTYYLCAVVRRDGCKPVVSQRTVRAIDTGDIAKRLGGARVFVLGGDDTITRWLKANNAQVVTNGGYRDAAIDVILVWDVERLLSEDRLVTAEVLGHLDRGGRLVIVNQPDWRMPSVVDIKIGKGERGTIDKLVASRAHRFPGAEHPMFRGIEPEYLWRWNGLPGTVSDETLLGDLPEGATPLLWAVKPEHVVAATIARGRGRIDVCLLKLRHRIDRQGEVYDPVAERVLANLLGK